MTGEMSPHYMASTLLSIPSELLHAEKIPEQYRFVPAWVYEPVTLHRPQPGPSDDHPWCRPGDDASDIEKAVWLDSIAQQLGVVAHASRARGGMLVLCTSYSILNGLADRLQAEFGPRLLRSKKGGPLKLVISEFFGMQRGGVEPIWFALGAAWTGLDLRDRSVSPESDRALTDLVIVSAPFGLNRTSTHLARRERNQVGAFRDEAKDDLVKTRQGCGRLVRGQGVKDRHLWILDPRLFDPRRSYSNAFRRVFLDYEKQGALDVIQPPG
jgi:CRISPR type IV-associated DEAD/DEAH-box helicase Csf4